jgi:hypothetical protein
MNTIVILKFYFFVEFLNFFLFTFLDNKNRNKSGTSLLEFGVKNPERHDILIWIYLVIIVISTFNK